MSNAESVGLTIVGAGIGFAVGGPAGALYGAQIGMTAGGIAFAEDMVTESSGPRLNDLKLQVSHPGWAIPKGWGTVGHAGAVFWSGGIEELSETTETDQGGKGGSNTQSHTTYNYTASFAVLFHDGEISGVRRVWANATLVFDAGGVNDYDSLSSENLANWIVMKSENLAVGDGTLTLYPGNETQAPDPTIQSYEGVDNTPAHRGRAYLVFTDMALAEYGNTIPNITIEYINTAEASFDTPAEEVLAFDYSPLLTAMDASAINNGMVCTDNALTAHLLIGNWGTSYQTSFLKYFKLFPDGTESFDKSFVMPVGTAQLLVSNSEYPTGFFRDISNSKLTMLQMNDANLYILNAASTNDLSIDGLPAVTVSSSVQSVVQIGSVSLGKIALWADPENDGNVFRIYDYYAGAAFLYTSYFDGAMNISHHDVTVAAGAKVGFSFTHSYLYVVYSSNTILKYDHSGALIDTWVFTPDFALITEHGGVYSPPDDIGHVYILNNGHLHVVDNGNYSYISTMPVSSVLKDPFYVKSGMLVRSRPHNDEVTFHTLGDVVKSTTPLSEIVTDLCIESGLTAGEIDVTALAGIDVQGFIKTKLSSAISNLTPLMIAFQFSAYDDDGKLIFKPKGLTGGDIVVDEEHLGAGIEASVNNILNYNRLDDLALPKILNVSYINYEKRYDQGSATSKRSDLVVSTEKRDTIELPIIMTVDDARRIAEKTQQVTWTSRNRYSKIQLPLRYLEIVPTDVLNMTVGGDSHRIRVTGLNIGEFIEIDGVNESSTDYSSVIEGGVVTTEYQGGASKAGTQLYILDAPTLRDLDGDARHYIAAHGDYGDWPGCVIYARNPQGGYANLASITGGITAGVTIDALPSGEHAVIDDASTVIVRMRNGIPSSVTKDVMLGDKTINSALIGVNGRWELVQFMTVTDNGDGGYTLSGFIRGQNGTEWAIGTHDTNDLFIMMDSSKMTSVVGNDRDVSIGYKAVTMNRPFKTGSDYSFVNTLESIKPLAPGGLRAERLNATQYTVSWNRRARLRGAWLDYVDVPLSEASESYSIEHYQSGVLVSTTIQSSNSLVVATSAGDGFLVSQISELYGPGHQSQVTIV